MKVIIVTLALAAIGCVNNNKDSYQAHLEEGDGAIHLYTGHDYKDAKSYVKEYEKSHGDLKIVPVLKD